MTSDKFNDSVNSLLENGRVLHVISVLKDKCIAATPQHPGLAAVYTELEKVETTYSHLRRFLLSGNPDPERERIYEGIVNDLRKLARRYLFIINENRLDPFFNEFRMQKVRQRTLSDLLNDFKKINYRIEMALQTEADPQQFLQKKEETVDEIFKKIWTLPPWAEDERKTLIEFLSDKDFENEFDLKSQMISALLLGLLKFFDPDKFFLLLKAYDSFTDDRLAARSLTAIVLVLSRWGRSSLVSDEIKREIELLENSLLTYTRVKEIVMTLIKTRDTDRVSKEVDDAFRSTMNEITPEMLEKLKRDGLAIDDGETGMNPEWEKLMKNKELEEKMQSINDMQLQGMDVMMQTFSRLKSFPFFNTMSNWLLPFNSSHSKVSELFREFDSDAFEAIADATGMCSGDRYSFVFGILQMPEDKRHLLTMNINASLEALKDHLKDKENVRKVSLFSSEALCFARDLYRFSKLYQRHKDFPDPFEQPLDFLSTPMLSSLLEDDDIIKTAADFYFQYGYYQLALSLLEKVTESGEANRQIFEKIGYCWQKLSDFSKAKENYEKADLFSSDIDRSSNWLLKKLAFTNKALGNYSRAAEYYDRLLERNPDNLNTLFHLGSVLLRSGDTRRAKEIIFKVHYLDPEHKGCARIYQRLKGHEAFMEGRYEDALKHYESARGNQDAANYRADLAKELVMLYPDADIKTLHIVIDA